MDGGKNIKILDFELKYHKRLIYIKENKNKLNLNKDTKLLDPSYFNILDKLAKDT